MPATRWWKRLACGSPPEEDVEVPPEVFSCQAAECVRPEPSWRRNTTPEGLSGAGAGFFGQCRAGT